jgi:hypothetical protein
MGVKCRRPLAVKPDLLIARIACLHRLHLDKSLATETLTFKASVYYWVSSVA